MPSTRELTAIWRLFVLRSGIVFVLGLAALSRALQLHTIGGWALLLESLIGVLLGGSLLLYPLVPLGTIAAFLAAWILARGLMLLTVVRRTASDVGVPAPRRA